MQGLVSQGLKALGLFEDEVRQISNPTARTPAALLLFFVRFTLRRDLMPHQNSDYRDAGSPTPTWLLPLPRPHLWSE